MIEIANKSVLVFGLGASGQAATRLLLRQGAAKVIVLDQASHEELRHRAEGLRRLGAEVFLGVQQLPPGDFDFGVVSPGIPPEASLLQEANRRGIPLLGELELGYHGYRPCPLIAVTGTNGKTTTTELIEQMLLAAGKRTKAAGNIGLPLCQVVLDHPDLEVLVLEVSSYQLESIRRFRPFISVFLNFTPDHLDRYANLEEYFRAKARIFANQQAEDLAIVQAGLDREFQRRQWPLPARRLTFSVQTRDADLWQEDGLICHRLGGEPQSLLHFRDTKLQGLHNLENVLAACAVGLALELPKSRMLAGLKAYHPAAHRCEVVAVWRGVVFINDSKATNPDAVAKALQSVPGVADGRPNVWLIAGGKDKGLACDDLGRLVQQRVRGAILLGEAAPKIHQAWRPYVPCTHVNSLSEAVNEAARKAVPGDVILLSPACSSFDMFRDYGHRGEVFRQAVKDYIESQHPPAARGCRSANARGGGDGGQLTLTDQPGNPTGLGSELLHQTTKSKEGASLRNCHE